MDNILRVSLYRYGAKVCEQDILPFLIRQLEPLRDQGVTSFPLPNVDPLVTEYELKETLRKYQVADYLFKYGLIGTLIIIAYGLSKVFAFISSILSVPEGLRPALILISGIAFFLFWLGAYMRMKSRWEEWQKIRNIEISLEKIEYYAKATSSTVIAQLLVDIERVRETQKQESEKARNISATRSLMHTENLMILENMLGQIQEKNRWKSIVTYVISFLVGYASEKGLDKFMLNIRG